MISFGPLAPKMDLTGLLLRAELFDEACADPIDIAPANKKHVSPIGSYGWTQTGS